MDAKKTALSGLGASASRELVELGVRVRELVDTLALHYRRPTPLGLFVLPSGAATDSLHGLVRPRG